MFRDIKNFLVFSLFQYADTREQEFFKMKIIRRGEQQGLDSFFPRPRWLFRKSNDRYWQRDIPDPFSSTQVKRY